MFANIFVLDGEVASALEILVGSSGNPGAIWHLQLMPPNSGRLAGSPHKIQNGIMVSYWGPQLAPFFENHPNVQPVAAYILSSTPLCGSTLNTYRLGLFPAGSLSMQKLCKHGHAAKVTSVKRVAQALTRFGVDGLGSPLSR